MQPDLYDWMDAQTLSRGVCPLVVTLSLAMYLIEITSDGRSVSYSCYQQFVHHLHYCPLSCRYAQTCCVRWRRMEGQGELVRLVRPTRNREIGFVSSSLSLRACRACPQGEAVRACEMRISNAGAWSCCYSLLARRLASNIC